MFNSISEISSWTREDKLRIHVQACTAVIFCLLCKHTNDNILDDFPKISEHFPKISEVVFKSCPKATRMFPNIFWKFPKISEDNRRFLRKNRSCFDHRAINLRDYVTIAIGIFLFVKIACCFHMWNNMLFSRVKISCLLAKAHLVFHCCLYNNY